VPVDIEVLVRKTEEKRWLRRLRRRLKRILKKYVGWYKIESSG
jgi:hypothetical protein